MASRKCASNDTEDTETIKKATDELTSSSSNWHSRLSANSTARRNAGDPGTGPSDPTGDQQKPGGEDVVDGEFKSV